MAAADDEVRQVEVEEVLGFIDKPSLGAEDLARLEELARASLQSPPSFDALLGQLSKVARKPAIARLVVDDLARVAAADSREDPRETRMLDSVCDALQLERVQIRIEQPDVSAPIGASPQRSATSAQPRIVTQHRARTAVRKALEASYREDAGRS